MTRLWSCAATGATPYFDDIAADLYSNANGRLRFREGKTGTINAVCDVQNVRDLASVRHLRVTFRDAGRAPERGRVAAVLKKVHVTTGNIDNVVGISSDSVTAGPDEFRTAVSVSLPPEEIPLNDDLHFYYVVITIERSNAQTQNPTVLGVSFSAGV
jgi:hypothetical protein